MGQHPAPQGPPGRQAGQAWTKIIREITVAAALAARPGQQPAPAHGSGDKATDANMPGDNIQRVSLWRRRRRRRKLRGSPLRRYGIGGAAVIVDCMTDNRTRTVAEVRYAFAKHGGNLGQEGSVAFMFKHCGQFVFAPGTSEEAVMEAALEAGAEDIATDEEGVIEVVCAPADFTAVRQAFEAAGLKAEVDGVVMKALNETELTGEDAVKDAEAARRPGKPGRRAGGLHQRRVRRSANQPSGGRAARFPGLAVQAPRLLHGHEWQPSETPQHRNSW